MTFPSTMWIVESVHRGARDELHKFIQEKCENVEVNENSIKGELPANLNREHAAIERKVERSGVATKIITRSFVVSFVSQFDSFLGGMVHVLLYKRPELLNSSERSMTFKELSQFASIEEAREHVVEKEVETLIRKSHSEQFDWMEKKFSVELRKGLDVWPRFIEITERRNLFVHCDSKASSQYLAVCRANGVDCTSISIGSDLPVTRNYLVEAYESIFEVGIKLAHVLWRKLAPDEIEKADANLNQVALDILSEGRIRLAKRLLDFAVRVLKRWGSEAGRRVFVLNRAQAYKWLKEEDECRKIIEAEDWTAVESKFSLAVAILRDDFPAAVEWMKKTGKDATLEEGYREWPIFRKFRKTSEFRIAHKEIFGKDFAEIAADRNAITFQLQVGKKDKKEKPSLSSDVTVN